jgi:hypothetical protein
MTDTQTPRGRPVLAVPGIRFGPELGLHVRVDLPGELPTLGAVPARRRHRHHRPFTVHAD